MITIEILTNMKILMMKMMVMAIINKKKRQVKSNYFCSLHYYIRGSIKQKLSFNQSCCYSMRYGSAGETIWVFESNWSNNFIKDDFSEIHSLVWDFLIVYVPLS